MARLYAATGDGIVRLDEAGEAWTVELALSGSGAQCLAVDPADPTPSTPVCARAVCAAASTAAEAGSTARLPEPGVFSLAVSAADGAVYAGTEPSRLFRSERPGRELARARGAARAAVAAELELPAAAVDVARALDRAQPARPRPAPGRDRARRADALDRRRAELAGPSSRRAAGCALARLAPTRTGTRI